MSDAGLSANAARGVKFGFEPASGLNDGDVVAFLDPDSGKPYAVRREEDPEGRGDAVFLFRVDLDAAEASVATARTLERLRNNEDAHLEVQKHGDFVGFRAAGANGRLLQATRKGACRLRFHGECFGTWEEWFLDARVAAEAQTGMVFSSTTGARVFFSRAIPPASVPRTRPASCAGTRSSSAWARAPSARCTARSERAAAAASAPRWAAARAP